MEISLNWLAIILITIVSFFFGAAWHGSFFFGKIWMRIHHGKDTFTDEEMKQAMQGMWKIMAAEFVATFFMVMTLDFLTKIITGFSAMHIAFMVWLGFVLPTMVSTVVWGNDPRKWMPTKIAISGSFRLVALLMAGYIFSIWK
jgi:hypothetical protein